MIANRISTQNSKPMSILASYLVVRSAHAAGKLPRGTIGAWADFIGHIVAFATEMPGIGAVDNSPMITPTAIVATVKAAHASMIAVISPSLMSTPINMHLSACRRHKREQQSKGASDYSHLFSPYAPK
jgi:hypothetical protein